MTAARSIKVTEEFRQSMHWLHTWLGLAVSSFLFVIFWMGSLSVFMYEVDQWMAPEKRIDVPENVSFDNTVVPYLKGQDVPVGSSIVIATPTERRPLTRVIVLGDEHSEDAYLHPATGVPVEQTNTYGASGFFYPFHYMLHISWKGLGYWVVGIAAVAMLALITSGIFVHRKIIQDFFTLRPWRTLRRSTLDLHNLSALAVLPFHILFPLTGITIMVLIYFPWSTTVAFDGDRWAYIRAANGYEQIMPISVAGPKTDKIDSYVKRAEAVWSHRSGKPANADYLRLEAYGDRNAKVVVQHTGPERSVARSQGRIVFDVATGEMTQDFRPKPLRNSLSWLEGAHYIMFDHWPLRWLYFLSGLAGAAMIASGLLFWMHARIRRGMEPVSVRFIRGLSVGSITGIIMASGAFLVMNRLLEGKDALLGIGRADVEVLGFFLVWIGSFLHASIRQKKAWPEQTAIIAGIACIAVVLNWITTGDNLSKTLANGLWSVAGVDLVLLTSAAVAVWATVRMRRYERTAAGGLTALNLNTKPVK